MTGAWRELFPNGRVIIYEGDEPEWFAAAILERFGFDPSADERWDAENEHARWFLCPAEHLDQIYGSSRYRVGS